MLKSAIAGFEIEKVADHTFAAQMDYVAVEDPLEIRIKYGHLDNRHIKNLSITMRTPGSDNELATGFLFTEGIVTLPTDIVHVSHHATLENVVEVSLNENVSFDLKKIERHFYTSSSCGVCGKSSIEAVKMVLPFMEDITPFKIDVPTLFQLPDTLRKQQDVFEYTGGLHAAAFFNIDGELKMMREDVGRHNALDKLIGSALINGWIPVKDWVLLLSGRASFELLQKAAIAGIRMVAAVGAPSSLAVKIAREFNITLIGFLRDHRFNIYSGAHRIIHPSY